MIEGEGQSEGEVRGSSERSPEEQERSANLSLYGYAPGNYMGICVVCDKVMRDVDKRAVCCKACAERLNA